MVGLQQAAPQPCQVFIFLGCSHGRRGAQQGARQPLFLYTACAGVLGIPLRGVSDPWLVLLTGSEPLSYALVLLVHSPQIFTGLLCLGVNARSLASLPFPCHMLTHTCVLTVMNIQCTHNIPGTHLE